MPSVPALRRGRNLPGIRRRASALCRRSRKPVDAAPGRPPCLRVGLRGAAAPRTHARSRKKQGGRLMLISQKLPKTAPRARDKPKRENANPTTPARHDRAKLLVGCSAKCKQTCKTDLPKIFRQISSGRILPSCSTKMQEHLQNAKRKEQAGNLLLTKTKP